MKIIIGAMQEELQQLVNDINAEMIEDSLINEFYCKEKDTIIAWTGIGTVNASTGLSYLLTKYADQVEYVINAGTSGCVDKSLNRGDFVIVNNATFSTANSTGFGYEYGQLPNMPEFYKATDSIKQIIESALTNQKSIDGNVATSDIFFQSFDKVEKLLKRLPIEIEIAEMECAAFFQTAYIFKTQIAAIKIVSDVIGEPNPNEEQFDKFLPKAANSLSKLIQKII